MSVNDVRRAAGLYDLTLAARFRSLDRRLQKYGRRLGVTLVVEQDLPFNEDVISNSWGEIEIELGVVEGWLAAHDRHDELKDDA